MADWEHRGSLLRRALSTNLRYYAAVGRHTIEYLQALAALIEDGASHDPPRPPERRPTVPAGSGIPAAPAPAPTPQPAAALVLEAGHGGTATGLFMVENALSAPVSTPIIASEFSSEDGRTVAAALALEPEVVTLAPGEQILVRVSAAIDESFDPEVGYRGELSAPGLPGTRVPLILRRSRRRSRKRPST